MNATQAKTALEGAVRQAGGTLEEDTTRRGLRCFQLCAPYGRVWAGPGTKHIRVEVDTRREAQPEAYNAGEVSYARSLLRRGHRPMTEAESFECDETPA